MGGNAHKHDGFSALEPRLSTETIVSQVPSVLKFWDRDTGCEFEIRLADSPEYHSGRGSMDVFQKLPSVSDRVATPYRGPPYDLCKSVNLMSNNAVSSSLFSGFLEFRKT